MIFQSVIWHTTKVGMAVIVDNIRNIQSGKKSETKQDTKIIWRDLVKEKISSTTRKI